MKKNLFFLLILISIQSTFGAEHNRTLGTAKRGIVGKWVQNISDTFNKQAIVDELRGVGVSADLREGLTQEHRLDRAVYEFIEAGQTGNLCDLIAEITASSWPVSKITKQMAHQYLWNLRPTLSPEAPLAARVVETLDQLNKTQIIDDLDEGQTYSTDATKIEFRINQAFGVFVEREDQINLIRLITSIKRRNASSEDPLQPGKRALNTAFTFLRAQAQLAQKTAGDLVEAFGAEMDEDSAADDQ